MEIFNKFRLSILLGIGAVILIGMILFIYRQTSEIVEIPQTQIVLTPENTQSAIEPYVNEFILRIENQ